MERRQKRGTRCDSAPFLLLLQGIVIEFSNQSGLIKCTQNPQLYFHMCEVLEKKKLELNEKVEFSVVPVSSPVSD